MVQGNYVIKENTTFFEEAMSTYLNNKKVSAMRRLGQSKLGRGNRQRPDYIGLVRHTAEILF